MRTEAEWQSKYIHLADRFWQMIKCGFQREKKLEELLLLIWSLSVTPKHTLAAMSEDQRKLFDSLMKDNDKK